MLAHSAVAAHLMPLSVVSGRLSFTDSAADAQVTVGSALAFVVALAVNVTSIVSSHCSLVACVVVSCLDFPIVACSAAGSSDEVTVCSVAWL